MENTLLLYALKSVLYAGVLTGYYWFGLRNQVFHQYNRFYLLGAVVLALILPLISWTWTVNASTLPDWTAWSAPSHETAAVPQKTFSVAHVIQRPMTWVWMGLAVTSALRLLAFVRGWMQVARYTQQYPGTPMHGFVWHNTALPEAPFSFFKRLFWREDVVVDSENGQRMLAHELTHIREKHSWDNLLLQGVLIISWFNPFFWIIKREMQVIHEFLADRKTVSPGDAAALAQVLLSTIPAKQPFAHHFSQSPIKRRIMMITKPPQTKLGYWSRLAVIPVLAGCFLALSASKQADLERQDFASVPDLQNRLLADTSKPLKKRQYQGQNVKSVTVHPNEDDPARMVHVVTTQGTEYWMSVDQAKKEGILPPPPPPPPPPPAAPKGKRLPPPPPTPPVPAASAEPGMAENDLPRQPVASIQITGHRASGDVETVTIAGPITLRNDIDPSKKSAATPIYVVDGKIVSAAALEQIRPEQIELVQVLKGKTATDKYGANAEPGVVEITTKQ